MSRWATRRGSVAGVAGEAAGGKLDEAVKRFSRRHILTALEAKGGDKKEAAKALGVAAADIPASTSRGKETFFDGKVFDPENPAAYLKSLSIKRVDV